jgi:hypothetical protein
LDSKVTIECLPEGEEKLKHVELLSQRQQKEIECFQKREHEMKKCMKLQQKIEKSNTYISKTLSNKSNICTDFVIKMEKIHSEELVQKERQFELKLKIFSNQIEWISKELTERIEKTNQQSQLVEMLRQQLCTIKKENEILKKENDQLKKQLTTTTTTITTTTTTTTTTITTTTTTTTTPTTPTNKEDMDL